MNDDLALPRKTADQGGGAVAPGRCLCPRRGLVRLRSCCSSSTPTTPFTIMAPCFAAMPMISPPSSAATMPAIVSHHFMGNRLFDIHGDDATGETYAINSHVITPEGGEARDYIAGGRYLDRFRRTDAGWRIARSNAGNRLEPRAARTSPALPRRASHPAQNGRRTSLRPSCRTPFQGLRTSVRPSTPQLSSELRKFAADVILASPNSAARIARMSDLRIGPTRSSGNTMRRAKIGAVGGRSPACRNYPRPDRCPPHALFPVRMPVVVAPLSTRIAFRRLRSRRRDPEMSVVRHGMRRVSPAITPVSG